MYTGKSCGTDLLGTMQACSMYSTNKSGLAAHASKIINFLKKPHPRGDAEGRVTDRGTQDCIYESQFLKHYFLSYLKKRDIVKKTCTFSLFTDV